MKPNYEDAYYQRGLAYKSSFQADNTNTALKDKATQDFLFLRDSAKIPVLGVKADQQLAGVRKPEYRGADSPTATTDLHSLLC